MALKADRIHIDSLIDFFMNETASRGGVVSVSTTGSGTAMDQSAQLATYAASTSGIKPLGVLMCDVVNNDLTRMHENWNKEEVQLGGKVTIWSKGTVVTDRIYPGHTPLAGQTAYVCASGYIGNAATSTDSSEAGLYYHHRIGRFLSTKDEDGYAKVSVNLP